MSDTSSVINPGLIARVKNIILKPAQEWEVIKAEPSSVQALFVGYAMILAAIGPICELIGGQLFGYGVLGVHWRPDLVAAIAGAVAGYVTALVGVFLLGLVIENLAPSFGGVKDPLRAMKVAVYSSTAGWLVGVFSLVPALSALAILALYGLYLLYLGLPSLMEAPKDRALVFTIVTVIVAIVVFVVVGWVSSQVTGLFGGGPDLGDVSGLNIRIG
jgi:hypothetical protein